MSKVSYSIRIDEQLREEMREVPDMPERIRSFIKQEVRSHHRGEMTPAEEFCHAVIDDYSKVGAYCLYQLDNRVKRDYYLDNLETRFAVDDDVDIQEARLAAKKIADKWDDTPFSMDDIVEEVLEQRGFLEEFYRDAVERVEQAVEDDDSSRWAFWTVLQIYRHNEGRQNRSIEGYRIKKNSIERTLTMGHGFDEEQVETAIDELVAAGGLESLRNTNAYFYEYVHIRDFLIDAFEEGLTPMIHEIRDTVRNYAEEDPYLEKISRLTRSDEEDLYIREMSEDIDDDDVAELIKDGATVITYDPGRSSTGRRSSLPSKSLCVLAPVVRQVVGDAFYRRQAAT